MNNLLCSTLLFCVILILINADCLTNYPEVDNAVFSKDKECGDLTFSCDNGFKMEQTMECVNGTWIYQKPFCKPPECRPSYKYNRDKSIGVRYSRIGATNQTECDELCDDNPLCSTTRFDEDKCDTYRKPVIFVSQPTDLEQCIAQCNRTESCIMLSHSRANDQCHLFNVTLDNLPGRYRVETRTNDTIVEKVCL